MSPNSSQPGCQLDPQIAPHSPPHILHPLHVAVQVSDLDLAEAFYTGIIGLQKVERNLTFPGTWYQIGDFQLHLIVSQWAKHPPRENKWGRHPHLTFAIDNLETVKQSLAAQAVPYQMSSSGRAALFVKDPDGNVIELLQVNGLMLVILKAIDESYG